jgi:hypothetical protein
VPSRSVLAKRQAVNKVGLIARATHNIQQPEATETKNPLVGSITAINTIPLAIMDAGRSHMTDPLHGHKVCHQQPVQTRMRECQLHSRQIFTNGNPGFPSIHDRGAVGPLKMCNDLIEQTCHHAPLVLFPFLAVSASLPRLLVRAANEPRGPDT